MATMEIIIGIVIVLFVLIFAGYFISIYNSLVRLKNNIEKAWSNIDVLLKQRHDELTKLLSTVKGYKDYEKDVLVKVTEARTAFMKAESVHEKAQADNVMTSALKSIFAVAENYPQLKANESFLQFQNRISEIENQISDRREFYNDSVNTFNIRIEQIPYVFIANYLRYTRKELFKVEESDRKDVEIKF
ncbi:MAG: LemA family protein [Candidatus Methanoperedens sp.]|jgi:LemA protein|nr:LemA family protein [Candidatus Methanoperedens sp.]PKL54663.1 MAG: LemA family protein [Candidatus Methanoperedenaceae archaeon HGW-Methanoperedenaceae-1]